MMNDNDNVSAFKQNKYDSQMTPIETQMNSIKNLLTKK